jgi:hypothetical protein
MFAGSMVTVVYISHQEYDTARAAAAGKAAPGADSAAAAMAAVGLVAHGSPSPDRGEGGAKVRGSICEPMCRSRAAEL